MIFACLWGGSSQAPISTASCSDPTGLFDQKSLLSCDSVADERGTGEGSLGMIEICEEEAYVVPAVMLAPVVLAAVVVAAVGAAADVESRLLVGWKRSRTL